MRQGYLDEVFNLKDEVAIITGGLGQLGVQFTRSLLNAGAKVAIFDIGDFESCRRLDDMRDNDNLKFYRTDITDKKSITKSVDSLNEEFGAPTVLINNAALDNPPTASEENCGRFEDYPEELWDKITDVNLKGIFLMSQIAGKKMAEKKKGSIINISSIYGLLSPNQDIYEYKRRQGKVFFKPVAYSVSKSGIYNLTRYLATYWAKDNVRVNTLTLAGVFNNQDKEFLENYSKNVPMGRMANEDEYNGAIIFLASDASRYMTGSNIVIDGGYSSW